MQTNSVEDKSNQDVGLLDESSADLRLAWERPRLHRLAASDASARAGLLGEGLYQQNS